MHTYNGMFKSLESTIAYVFRNVASFWVTMPPSGILGHKSVYGNTTLNASNGNPISVKVLH